ncbi:alpha/beta-Hydrolases superfamily protein [Striga asiatica]|uniref:Alpha/beta-Hydrolases superfamily protein n=1 Tax=Striga asiatica TaxID=4170 RepID=A0A5A7QI35_STRAF|nr:alpha/beta-Hydrolases superfamily protein [Striga asiatica]
MTNVGAAHNVTVLGSGETTVVLGHGFCSNQSVWRHFVPHLVDEYRVILYDDMGASTTDPNAFDFQRYSTVEGFVNDLISILEEFKVERLTNAEDYYGGTEAEKYDQQIVALEENPTEMYEKIAPLVMGCDANSTAVHEYTRNALSMKPDIRQHILRLISRLDMRACLGQVVPTQGHYPHLSSPEVINPVLLRHIREDIVGDDKSEKIEMEV